MAEDYLELKVTLQSLFYYKDFFLETLSNALDIIINGKLYNVIEISITTMIEHLLKNVSSVNESHLVLSQIKEVDGSVLI